MNSFFEVSKRLRTVAVALLCWATAGTGAAQDASWEIGPRPVPAPAGASEELRQSIGATPAPNVGVRKSFVPESDAVWRRLIAQRAASATPLAELEKRMGVKVEPDEIEGVGVYRVTPAEVVPAHAKRLFVHVHGGAYVFSGGDACAGEAALIAGRVGIPVISIDYRMPPDHPFPAAVDDVVTVYRELLKSIPASAMAIGGTSAGGGLALASVHRFREFELALPGAVYAGTPWADLTKTGDTLFTNEGLDRALVTYDGALGAAARLYAGGEDMKHPLISPVYGDFAGFPPTYLVTGTRDMFLSDTARTHRKLRDAGAIADLHVYEGMSHAEYALVLNSPESRSVFAELDGFLRKHLK